MNAHYKNFIKQSEKISFDLNHRKTIKFNMSKYDAAVERGMSRYADIEKIKNHIAARKRKALKNLDETLLVFEKNALKNGIKVHWASNTQDALNEISEIIKEKNARKVVKMKSMTSEEIELNEFLEKQDTEVVETDLGEFIVQVAGEKPYHIVTPAMHKSKKDVNDLFHRLYGMDENSTAEEMTEFVRQLLRKKFTEADIGITGANFIVADIGGIATTENEGNGIMSASFPKTHIVLAGIEKVIPSMKDLGAFWPTLAVHGTGQAITVYNTIYTGPRKANEDFGPDEMHVILLDNKRTTVLNEKFQADSLACIRCGACLNACPIYRNIGGYTYESTYSGPIGSVLTPFYQGFDLSGHLSYACTICGKCTEVCPQKIDLHELLLHNRQKDVEEIGHNGIFALAMSAYQFFSLHASFFNIGMHRLKNLFVKIFAKNGFGKRREMPEFKEPFRKQFAEKYKK